MPALLESPTRKLRSRIFDSARWNDYQPRDDDIIIGTYSKCGTTWMQRIIGMLIFRSAAPRAIPELSPWLEFRLRGPVEPMLAAAEAQVHRRFFKTHLPLDALPIYEGVKFIHVARDGRDAALSFHNHLMNFTPALRQRLDDVSLADPKFGDVYPPIQSDPTEFFTDWITSGGDQGDPGASFFHVENTYWRARSDPNMLLVHYDDLKHDRDGEMRRIAAYLEIEIPESLWPDLIEAAGFNAMKANGEKLLPHAQHTWSGGASTFLNKGISGQWQNALSANALSANAVERYDIAIEQHFPADLACWIRHGRLGNQQSVGK
jgi:aryl sulfotransferase